MLPCGNYKDFISIPNSINKGIEFRCRRVAIAQLACVCNTMAKAEYEIS